MTAWKPKKLLLEQYSTVLSLCCVPIQYITQVHRSSFLWINLSFILTHSLTHSRERRSLLRALLVLSYTQQRQHKRCFAKSFPLLALAQGVEIIINNLLLSLIIVTKRHCQLMTPSFDPFPPVKNHSCRLNESKLLLLLLLCVYWTGLDCILFVCLFEWTNLTDGQNCIRVKQMSHLLLSLFLHLLLK